MFIGERGKKSLNYLNIPFFLEKECSVNAKNYLKKVIKGQGICSVLRKTKFRPFSCDISYNFCN